MASSVIFEERVEIPYFRFFRIHARGTEGFEPVSTDAEDFQRSAVFDRRFRLDRRRNARGRWVFDLHSQTCER